MSQPSTLIFWGAGATAALGIPTTVQQGRFIRKLANTENSKRSLQDRVSEALGAGTGDGNSALYDLLTILGDSNSNYRSIDVIEPHQREAMRRNWRTGATDEELQDRIVWLRLIYDWPALKSVIGICPASATDNFKINDLFNVLDMHIPQSFGFHTPWGGGEFPGSKREQITSQFLDARRLVGARNALLLVLMALFHVSYRTCIATKQGMLEQYCDFARQLALRMRRQGIELFSSDEHQLDSPAFYQGDIGFVSLNYDPIGLWIQFIAHRELNNNGSAPHIGVPATPLHLYHDFGHVIPARAVERKDAGPWYPLNESTAMRLNEEKYPSGYRVRLTKFLLPHGCLCWRECPSCGKLSAYHGDEWSLFSEGLFPPPPLRAFDARPCPARIGDAEKQARNDGRVDARACLHCGTLTEAQHTQAIMQSSFKSEPPSFIQEIQRELRATAMRADHIIFMGYSLPPDDVTYRAFFAALCQRDRQPNKSPPRCTIIGKNDGYENWYAPQALNEVLKDKPLPENHAVMAALDIFGKGNVRFYGGGIPNVFLNDANQTTTEKIEQIINANW